MNYEPHKPSVENPLALVLRDGRVEATRVEETLQRYFAAGIMRLADERRIEPRAALEKIEDCARVVIARYNEENKPTPKPGALNTEV